MTGQVSGMFSCSIPSLDALSLIGLLALYLKGLLLTAPAERTFDFFARSFASLSRKYSDKYLPMIHWHTQVSRKYRGQFYSENPKQTLCEGSDVLWKRSWQSLSCYTPYYCTSTSKSMPSRSRYYIHQLCIIYIFIYNWRISYSYIFSRVSLQLVYLPSNRVNCFHRKDANVHHYTSPLFPLRWVRRSQHFSTKINKVKAVWSSLLSDLLIRCLLAPCSMSLSVSLCGVSLLPQFCRNSAAILPQWCVDCVVVYWVYSFQNIPNISQNLTNVHCVYSPGRASFCSRDGSASFCCADGS